MKLQRTDVATRHLHAVLVPMRDGRTLRTDVALPPGQGPWPATLLRTPYGRWQEVDRAHALCRDGVAVVLQDVAGRFESEGEFSFMNGDGQDAIDTIDWITAQPWSTGDVAMRGFSYRGFLQWDAALRHPPALRAVAPLLSPWWHRPQRFRAPGGPLQLATITHWLPRQAAEVFGIPRPAAKELYARSFEPEQIVVGTRIDPDKLRDHMGLSRWELADPWPVQGSAEFEPMWRDIFATPPARMAFEDRGPDDDVIEVPALVLAGWYDPSCTDAFLQFAHLRRTSPPPVRDHHRMIVLPLGHGDPLTEFPAGEATFRFGLDPDHDWSVEWLLDDTRALRDLAPVTYFLLGANTWQSAPSWPPPGARPHRLFLDPAGGRLAERPVARPSSAAFDYDPHDPVLSRGGTAFKLPVGPMDQDGLTGGARSDVLSFTAAPVSEALTLTGPVVVELYASSSALDTDFTAKLIDVAPDGRAMSICDGIVRARYRNGTAAEPLSPEVIERYRIWCGHVAYVLGAGHALRVDISSSNFPSYDRNANTGAPAGTDRLGDVVVARQRVQGSDVCPSNLTVMVVR